MNFSPRGLSGLSCKKNGSQSDIDIETMKLSDKLPDLTKWILQVFEDTVSEDILNNARKSGEALCKAVLLKHYGDDKGIKVIRGEMKRNGDVIPARNPRELNFETLINHMADGDEHVIIVNKTIRSQIQSNLGVIKAHCNPASHDPNSKEVRSDLGNVKLVRFALTELVIWFYEEFLQEPLPEILEQYVADARSSYVQGSSEGASYEDVRGLDIVKLCYPRQKIIIHTNHGDTSKKISYEFIAVEV